MVSIEIEGWNFDDFHLIYKRNIESFEIFNMINLVTCGDEFFDRILNRLKIIVLAEMDSMTLNCISILKIIVKTLKHISEQNFFN